MDFDFSDDQISLREAVGRWVEKGFGFERRHALAKAGGHSRAVYSELAELGLTALTIPEAQGGLGLGAVEAMLVMEELGRGLVHAPLVHGALVAPGLLTLAPDAVQSDWLPRMASGEALVVLAHQERAARYRVDRVSTRAEPSQATSGPWALTGSKGIVPAGDEADAFIVSAQISGAQSSGSRLALFLVRTGDSGVAVRGYPTQDGARAAEVTLNQAPAVLLTEDGIDALLLAQNVGIAGVCAEAVGLMDALMALTVGYMNVRKQFGATLASFQALRHRIADVKMQVELARSMSFYATLKLGEPQAARRRALSQAKVQIGRSARLVAQECVQLHGGIGVTDEYAASHYFKRLSMLELEFGDTMHHLGEVADGMQDTAGVFA
jgi:alkylation response protein AidB-like acyl-CoA dehydrogenase